MGDSLQRGEKLEVGQSLESQNGAYKLTLQEDGNLVLYAGRQSVWSTGTNGRSVVSAEVQADGNFVLYTANDQVWASQTEGAKSARLVLQDDRNLVLYGSDAPLWSSKTRTDEAPVLENPAPEFSPTVTVLADRAEPNTTPAVDLSEHQQLRVLLPESPSSGYVWTIKALPSGLAEVEAAPVSRFEDAVSNISYGGSIQKEFDFIVVSPADSAGSETATASKDPRVIVFELKRRWQTAKPPRAIQQVEVTVVASDDAEYAPPPPPPPPPPSPRTYTVVSGDTLWAIAERFYGDANRYHEIAAASGITNPDLVRPGEVVTIP